ncbi:MAG: nucleoside/nucleotide kinase family protein [Candidatus Planktophila sp.]
MSKEISALEAKEIVTKLTLGSKRTIIGIVGKPGGGKSTLSKFLLKGCDETLVSVLPMDGFHLSNKVLQSLGRLERKGAPDTFDVKGFTQLLERIARDQSNPIYYPIFDRSIEESIAAQGVVMPSTRVVIVEGNYLMHDRDGWQEISPLLDQSWYAYLDEDIRISRLISRHIAFGKDPESAKAWAKGSDQANAELIELSVARCDFLIRT